MLLYNEKHSLWCLQHITGIDSATISIIESRLVAHHHNTTF